MKQYRFVLNITRLESAAGPPVGVTYDSAMAGVSVTGNPHPSELNLIQKLVELCEAEVKGRRLRLVEADHPMALRERDEARAALEEIRG